MARRQGRRRKWTIEEALTGPDVPSPLTLLRLISQVNPTDRGLPPEEARARYQLKYRLESRLIAAYKADLSVQRESANVVLILHRPSGRGCHAVLPHLDGDARRWVQRQLDEALTEAPEGEPEENPAFEEGGKEQLEYKVIEGLSPEELLHQGQLALAEGRTREAQPLLVDALHRGGGAPETARAALTLLLDPLNAPVPILSTLDDLSQTVREDGGARSLLAMAASAAGKLPLAEELIQGSEGPWLGTAYLRLIEESLRQGQHLSALHLARTARERDAASKKELAALLAPQLPAMERTLSQLQRRGSPDEVEAMARLLLDASPGNTRAVSTLTKLRRQQERRQRQDLLRQGEEALRSGRYQEAINRILAIPQGSPPGRRASQILHQAREALARQDAQAFLDQMAHILEEGLTEEGLHAYLQQPPELRRKARSMDVSGFLDCLEEMTPMADPRAQEAVEALLALETAVVLYEEEGPIEEVLEFLSLYEDRLHRCEMGRLFLRLCREKAGRGKENKPPDGDDAPQ